MRVLDGFRLSIRRKLGRCLARLRLALVVAWGRRDRGVRLRWLAARLGPCRHRGRVHCRRGFAADEADQFCSKRNYECIDKDCPWLHWVNNTSTADCKCEQAADGRWKAICDLVYKTRCCCSPEL